MHEDIEDEPETMALRIEEMMAGVEMDGGSTTDIRSGIIQSLCRQLSGECADYLSISGSSKTVSPNSYLQGKVNAKKSGTSSASS